MKELRKTLIRYYKNKGMSAEALEKFYEYEVTTHVYESNAIEGSTLSFRETDLVINKGLTISGKTVQEIDEAIGTKKAFEFVINTLRTPMSVSYIQTINGLIRFKYPIQATLRDTNVRIGGSRVVLPAFNKVPNLLEEYVSDCVNNFKEFNLKDKPEQLEGFIEQLALSHVKFERIHPFIDGNGRTGRLLINLESLKQGLPPIHVKNENKEDYYNAFDVFDNCNNVKPMTDLIGKALLQSLDNYLSLVEESDIELG